MLHSNITGNKRPINMVCLYKDLLLGDTEMKWNMSLQLKHNVWLTRLISIFFIIICLLGSMGACSNQQEQSSTKSPEQISEQPSLPSEQDNLQEEFLLQPQYRIPSAQLEQMKEVIGQCETVGFWYGFPVLEYDKSAEPFIDPITKVEYYPVKNFQTIAEMKAETEKIFSKNYCETLTYPYAFEGEHSNFREINGRLYGSKHNGEINLRQNIAEDIQVFYYKENDIAVVNCKIKSLDSGKEYITMWPFVFVWENNRWVIGDRTEDVLFRIDRVEVLNAFNRIEMKEKGVEVISLLGQPTSESHKIQFCVKNMNQQIIDLKNIYISPATGYSQTNYKKEINKILHAGQSVTVEIENDSIENAGFFISGQCYILTARFYDIYNKEHKDLSYYYLVEYKNELAVTTNKDISQLESYEKGETVQLTIKNYLDSTITLSSPFVLSRFYKNDWEKVTVISNEYFESQLKPGESKQISVILTEEYLKTEIIPEQYEISFWATEEDNRKFIKVSAVILVQGKIPVMTAGQQTYYDQYGSFVSTSAPYYNDFDLNNYITNYDPCFLFRLSYELEYGHDRWMQLYNQCQGEFPAELVETIIQKHFYWDTERIRKELTNFSGKYDATTNVYYFPDCYSDMEHGVYIIRDYQIEGDTLYLDFEKYYHNGILYRAFTLTVQLSETGDKLAACKTTYQRENLTY